MNYVMMAASQGLGEAMEKTGLISGHAYSFIGVKEFEHNGEQVRLCQLRNPWGQGEWEGSWSDKDPVWTPELRKKHGIEDSNDGVFFIPFQDYLEQYAWTSIAVDEDEKYKRFAQSFEFHDEEAALFNIMLD